MNRQIKVYIYSQCNRSNFVFTMKKADTVCAHSSVVHRQAWERGVGGLKWTGLQSNVLPPDVAVSAYKSPNFTHFAFKNRWCVLAALATRAASNLSGGGGREGCADSLWLRAAFYSHLSPTSKHHTHVKNYDLQKGEQIKPLVSAFSFYCLLTDCFY